MRDILPNEDVRWLEESLLDLLLEVEVGHKQKRLCLADEKENNSDLDLRVYVWETLVRIDQVIAECIWVKEIVSTWAWTLENNLL